MAQSLTKIYLHIVFSTKYRANTIDENISDELYNYLGGICKNLECFPVKIGGYSNHIHILCSFSKKITLIKFVEELKKNSSKWIKTKDEKYKKFYWQDGYGAFSVNPYEIDKVANYIDNQKDHHKKTDFQKEFITFLEKNQVKYDERYIWD